MCEYAEEVAALVIDNGYVAAEQPGTSQNSTKSHLVQAVVLPQLLHDPSIHSQS